MVFEHGRSPVNHMEPLHTLDHSALVDLLAKYTAKYTELSMDGTSDPIEYLDCERMVLNLQQEIEARTTARNAIINKNSSI